MQGLMMDYPLTLTQFFERSRRLFAQKTLATRVLGGLLFRYTYADFAERVAAWPEAWRRSGCARATACGTFAWNTHHHLEAYWAVPIMGAVLHTVNFRLAPEDIAYIINHAEDSVLLVGASVWPLLEPIREALTTVRQFVIIHEVLMQRCLQASSSMRVSSAWARRSSTGRNSTSAPPRACATHPARPATQKASSTRTAPSTSTASAWRTVDSLALSEQDVILHVVPMFHANAWCVPCWLHGGRQPRSSRDPTRSLAIL